MRARTPAAAAALANAVAVLLLPIWLAGLARLFPDSSNASAGVVAADPARRLPAFLEATLVFAAVLVPLALIAAWRTWVHARAWQRTGTWRWRGVAEAAATGLLIAFAVLAEPTIRRPLEAPPYLITYGGIGAIAGGVLGLVLQVVAMTVLTVLRVLTDGDVGDPA